MALNPAFFDRIDGAAEDKTSERNVVPTIKELGPDNFELVLQSIGFPFSPMRTFTYSSRARVDAAVAGESQRFLDHLIKMVDR